MAVLLVGLLWFWYPPATVTLLDGDSGRLVGCWPIAAASPVRLVFTHSMYGGDVRETYLVTAAGELRRVDFRTERAAAADYYASTVSVWPDEGWFRVDAVPADYDEIAIRVDAVGAPRVAANDAEWPLLVLAGNQRQVILAGQSRWTAGACP